jgi:hypothetical protein
MKDEIIKKIASQLTALPIGDEHRVVYLPVEIRKVFERDSGLHTSLPTLEFYCDWALHTRLDRLSARRFLEEVRPILTLEGNHDQEAQDNFNRLLTLHAFRAETRLFLERCGLSVEICADERYWKIFLATYSRVVENCELVMEANASAESGPLNLAVESLSIRPLIRGTELPDNLPYPMEWAIAYRDGRKGGLLLSDHGSPRSPIDPKVTNC